MNHFFLWIGDPDTPTSNGHALLQHFKNTEAVTRLTGPGWSLSHAAQADSLGTHRETRVRTLALTNGVAQVLWCGHAWSKADGAQPAISLLDRDAASISNLHRVELVRENSNGVFGLVVIDDERGEIVVCADAIGSFQVYWRALPNGVAVSNSSALLAALEPRSALDPLGVQEFCSNAVANEDRSTWQEVRKLRASQLLCVDCRRPQAVLHHHRPLLCALNTIRTYAPDPVPSLFASMSDVLGTLQQYGGRGTEFRDLPWVADLTGGNDSRALMAAIIANHIKVASTVSGPTNDDDVRIGTHLARQLGIQHFIRAQPQPVTPEQFHDSLQLTDGEYDAIEYSGVAKVHRQHIRDGLQFSLNGSYGELARGHAWRMGLAGMLFPDRVAATLTRRGPLALTHPSVHRWHQLFALKNPAMLFSPATLACSKDYFPGIFARLLTYAGDLPWHAQLDLIHTDLRMERWQGRLLSNTGQIWPAISPWGFQAPHTQIMITNPTVRRNGLLTRAFTYAYAPVLAREPLYTGNPAMPFSLAQAHRFLPLISYFAGRAAQKVLSRFRHSPPQAAPSACDREPFLCADAEIVRWLHQPMLADTGLFDTDNLLLALAPNLPQSARAHQLWRRLLTIEAALHLQASVPNLTPVT